MLVPVSQSGHIIVTSRAQPASTHYPEGILSSSPAVAPTLGDRPNMENPEWGSGPIQDGEESNRPGQDTTHAGLADFFSQSQGWGNPGLEDGILSGLNPLRNCPGADSRILSRWFEADLRWEQLKLQFFFFFFGTLTGGARKCSSGITSFTRISSM